MIGVPLALVVWANVGGEKALRREVGLDITEETLERARKDPEIRKLSRRHASFADCPWCRSVILLKRDEGGAFPCPICDCRFDHNWKKWVIGLSTLVVLSVVGLTFMTRLMPGQLVVATIVGIAFAVVSPMKNHRIVTPGRTPRPEQTISDERLLHEAAEQAKHVDFSTAKGWKTAALAVFLVGLLFAAGPFLHWLYFDVLGR